jgi:nitrogen fixation protein FixH
MLPALHHPFKPWIPWLYVLLFVPVVAVNILLIRLALSSNTGLVTDRAYDTGQSYNAVIAAGERAQALGWRAVVDSQPAPLPAAPHRVALAVTLSDSAGRPLTGLTVTGRVVSPVDPQPDLVATLVETGRGHYRELLVLPRAGQWELQLIASDGSARYAIQQRLSAP